MRDNLRGTVWRLGIFLTVCLFGAFALVRLSTAGIRSGWWPFGNVRLGGRHIHHFVPGILMAFGCGTGALVTNDRRIERVLAIPFGAGMGLTFDEAALLLDLRDVYWSREGLLSVQVSLGTSALLGATILGLRMLRRGEERGEQQGLIPTEAGEIATPLPVPATRPQAPVRIWRTSSSESPTAAHPSSTKHCPLCPQNTQSFGRWRQGRQHRRHGRLFHRLTAR